MTSSLSEPVVKMAVIIAAAAGLTISSFNALAVPIQTPDPVPYPTGSDAALIPDPSPVAIPGFGFVDTFFIMNFDVVSYVADGADGLETLAGTFLAVFEDGSGNETGRAALPSDEIRIRILNRPENFDSGTGDPVLGTFDALLEMATFSGTTSSGDDMVVRLDPAATINGQISITENPSGGFIFDTPTPFIVQGQYSVNNGAFIDVPDLIKESLSIPEPTTISLAIAGALGGLVMGRRRRRLIAA